MAKFSKGHYELLTEAFGDAVAELKETGSPLLVDAGMRMARKVGNALKYDNNNFDQKQFIEGVEAHADLVILTKKGIH